MFSDSNQGQAADVEADGFSDLFVVELRDLCSTGNTVPFKVGDDRTAVYLELDSKLLQGSPGLVRVDQLRARFGWQPALDLLDPRTAVRIGRGRRRGPSFSVACSLREVMEGLRGV